ncbi:MAG: cytoplasmic glycerophosphodiester phosphodiesterase [Candidatus Bathyarchaeota archaeon BA2]|nr:MAG: cytoplasmic glycerophosphodiester phosphodiesterase [Candidatus Bathyarchaeota archaeon BA2]
MGKVLIIAHRGASAYEPENTLRSVKKALELGADMVEVDVRASRDGHIVVMHDAVVDRTTNGKGYVKDMTLKELKKLDAGLEEPIPTLQEVAELVRGKAQLVVEIKVPEIEGKVLRIIKENELDRQTLITSFHHPILKRVKELNPNIRTGAIVASRPIKAAQLALDATPMPCFQSMSTLTPKWWKRLTDMI